MIDRTFPAHDLPEYHEQSLRDKWDQEARNYLARNPGYYEEPLPPHYQERKPS